MEPIMDSKVKDLPKNCMKVYIDLKEDLPINGMSAFTPIRVEYMVFSLLVVYIIATIMRRF